MKYLVLDAICGPFFGELHLSYLCLWSFSNQKHRTTCLFSKFQFDFLEEVGFVWFFCCECCDRYPSSWKTYTTRRAGMLGWNNPSYPLRRLLPTKVTTLISFSNMAILGIYVRPVSGAEGISSISREWHSHVERTVRLVKGAFRVQLLEFEKMGYTGYSRKQCKLMPAPCQTLTQLWPS